MSNQVVGVDIGTTSTTAVVFDTDGRVVAHHAVEYPLLTPTPAAARVSAARAIVERKRRVVTVSRSPSD